MNQIEERIRLIEAELAELKKHVEPTPAPEPLRGFKAGRWYGYDNRRCLCLTVDCNGRKGIVSDGEIHSPWHWREIPIDELTAEELLGLRVEVMCQEGICLSQAIDGTQVYVWLIDRGGAFWVDVADIRYPEAK